MKLCLGLIAALSTACVFEEKDPFGPEYPTESRTLAEVRSTLQLTLLWDVGPKHKVATLAIDTKIPRGFGSPYDFPCIAVSGIRVLVDGASIGTMFSGGWQGETCLSPGWRGDLPATVTAQSTLAIDDGTKAIQIAIGDHLAPRTATLVSPPANGYRPGDTVAYRWSHPADLSVIKLDVSVRPAQASTISIPTGYVTESGGLLSFPLPQVPVGEHDLHSSWTASMIGCGTDCLLTATRRVAIPLRIAAP